MSRKMYTYSCMCIQVFDKEYPVVQVSPDSHPRYIAKVPLKLGIYPFPSYRYVCFVFVAVMKHKLKVSWNRKRFILS